MGATLSEPNSERPQIAVAAPGTAPGRIGPAQLVTVAAVVLVLVSGFVVLAALGRDTTAYALFLAGPLVTSAVGWLLSTRVQRVETLAGVAVHQTNGQMSAQFAGVHDHLDGQTGAVLAAVAGHIVPAAAGGAGNAPAGRVRNRLPEQAGPGPNTDQAVSNEADSGLVGPHRIGGHRPV
jgi:hypothetical protein